MVVDRSSLQSAGVNFHQQDPDILKVKKVEFVAFIAMVINGTATGEKVQEDINHCGCGGALPGTERFLGKGVT
jgi:hypothetical protein